MTDHLLSVSMPDTCAHTHYKYIHAAFINTHTLTCSSPENETCFTVGGLQLLHTHTHTRNPYFHPISFPGSLFAPVASPVSYSSLLGKLLHLHTDRHFTVGIREQGGGHSDLDYLSGVTEGSTLPSGCPQTARCALFVKDKHNTRYIFCTGSRSYKGFRMMNYLNSIKNNE